MGPVLIVDSSSNFGIGDRVARHYSGRRRKHLEALDMFYPANYIEICSNRRYCVLTFLFELLRHSGCPMSSPRGLLVPSLSPKKETFLL